MKRVLFALSVLAVSMAQAQSLGYLGQQHVATGFQYGGTVVGGLSSIDHDTAAGRFLAILCPGGVGRGAAVVSALPGGGGRSEFYSDVGDTPGRRWGAAVLVSTLCA